MMRDGIPGSLDEGNGNQKENFGNTDCEMRGATFLKRRLPAPGGTHLQFAPVRRRFWNRTEELERTRMDRVYF